MGVRPDRSHFHDIVTALSRAEIGLIPFLGAGVNLCLRPIGGAWQDRKTQYLPNAVELASHIAQGRGLSYHARRSSDLERVTQYVSLRVGYQPLYRDLHDIFDGDYPPTPAHDAIASAPAKLKRKGYDTPSRHAPANRIPWWLSERQAR